jgi:hypothetical protein
VVSLADRRRDCCQASVAQLLLPGCQQIGQIDASPLRAITLSCASFCAAATESSACLAHEFAELLSECSDSGRADHPAGGFGRHRRQLSDRASDSIVTLGWRSSARRSPTLPRHHASLGASCLCCLHATGDGIQNGDFCLFDRGNGVVDSKACFPLKPIDPESRQEHQVGRRQCAICGRCRREKMGSAANESGWAISNP